MTRDCRMSHVVRSLWIACAFAIAAGRPAPAGGQVQVGVQIGIPAPPPVLVSPPQFVVVPTTPSVRYAPDFGINVFLYGGRYYAWNDGAWFVTANAGQPWVFVEPARVPRSVLVVPARYYNLPPGQLKKVYGHGHGGHYKHHGDEDD